ncbi:hypothetical protein [Paludisphaera soli]|uniref:hypothetical protein n=1 Tax=Paludisphaera soli TaxID=2712865 RepID=UPI0013EA3983|nr:hypothetical protein [Paludisphaera soli]
MTDAGFARGRVVVAILTLACLAGCDDRRPPLTPLRGRLLFNDMPVAGAELVFHPQFDGPGWRPTAVTGEDGTFEAGTLDPGDGAPEGAYKVTIVWHPMAGEDGEDQGPNLLPERYSRVESTDLQVQAGPASAEPPTLRLTGPSRGKRR